ncbi:hypothetical protein L1987_30928 [Smallanthus sonchifolius]|uniref:Uncharacterized protein n=1 Tax=Smallanthus sonchifolius TaxID=185202 RepID=A0ACB9I470_9ASTR|nr:hypothetical protein L1987_30928 [Smallanthus sonchifolius]
MSGLTLPDHQREPCGTGMVFHACPGFHLGSRFTSGLDDKINFLLLFSVGGVNDSEQMKSEVSGAEGVPPSPPLSKYLQTSPHSTQSTPTVDLS